MGIYLISKFKPFYEPKIEQISQLGSNNESSNPHIKCVKTLKEHEKWCNCLIVLKSKNLCSCSADKSINIYSNDNKFNLIMKIKSCHKDYILYLEEIYNFIIVSTSSDGAIKFWKLIIKSFNNSNGNSYHLLQTIKGHEDDVWKVIFIKKNKHLISCGSDSFIKIWNIKYSNKNSNIQLNCELYKTLKEHKYWVPSILQVKNREKNINYLKTHNCAFRIIPSKNLEFF